VNLLLVLSASLESLELAEEFFDQMPRAACPHHPKDRLDEASDVATHFARGMLALLRQCGSIFAVLPAGIAPAEA
jgi:hypothetical protein